jgi:hypothetical protein
MMVRMAPRPPGGAGAKCGLGEIGRVTKSPAGVWASGAFIELIGDRSENFSKLHKPTTEADGCENHGAGQQKYD